MIDTRWQDERGKVLDSVPDEQNHLARAIQSADPRSTTCIRFIDPWGDTVFNQAQIPVLIQELTALRAALSDEESRDHLTRVIALATRAQGEVHTYIKFLGD